MPWTEVRDENVHSAVDKVDMDSVINVIATCYLNTSGSRAKASNLDVNTQVTHQNGSNQDFDHDTNIDVDEINGMVLKGKRMHARVLTGSKEKPLVSTKMLIDSGNSGRSLISENFAKVLKLQLHPCKYSIKTAQGGPVTILGETNQLKFALQNCNGVFKWPFLVVRDLCCPGVIGMDFITFHNVGIQVNKHAGNFMSFLEWPGIQVPLVEPNSPNLPEPREDPRFQGASIFRQRGGKGATAAACQEEVGIASKGKPVGRPPDQVLEESCNLTASQVNGKEGYLLNPNAHHCGPRGVDPSNPDSSTQVDVSSYSSHPSAHPQAQPSAPACPQDLPPPSYSQITGKRDESKEENSR